MHQHFIKCIFVSKVYFRQRSVNLTKVRSMILIEKNSLVLWRGLVVGLSQGMNPEIDAIPQLVTHGVCIFKGNFGYDGLAPSGMRGGCGREKGSSTWVMVFVTIVFLGASSFLGIQVAGNNDDPMFNASTNWKLNLDYDYRNTVFQN